MTYRPPSRAAARLACAALAVTSAIATPSSTEAPPAPRALAASATPTLSLGSTSSVQSVTTPAPLVSATGLGCLTTLPSTSWGADSVKPCVTGQTDQQWTISAATGTPGT